MSKPLFDGTTDESDNESDLKFETNEEYAKSYNSFRKKELLKKFKDRGYNNVADMGSSEESDSSEDDDNDELDPQFDREFFKTLASLKSKDPAIYDKKTRFFAVTSGDGDGNNANDASKTEEIKDKANSKKTKKPVTLKDYERQVILEHGGKFEEDSDDQLVEPVSQRSTSPSRVEEDRHLKEEFKRVLNADHSDDEEFGGIFKKRIKSNEEKTQEEADFANWLAGKKADIEAETKQKLEPLKNYWSKRDLPQSERFLRDYILNKGYSNVSTAKIPTYEEIVGEEFQPSALSDDEKELDKQAEFEEKYNFRFEEPDTEFIKRYPRTIENSVRLDSGKRKEKRQDLKHRKNEEKERKMKEIEIVKEMKRKEIEEKIEKLKKVTGNDELGFNDAELEEDFDPEAHDRRMHEIFNDEYYKVDEGEEKPECPSDVDELKIEDWDNYDPAANHNYDGDDYEPHCEDDDFNMDCDYDPVSSKEQFQQELIENTKRRKNRRGRRNRFMEMIQQEKPAFDPEDEKTYGEYIEEYYKMDCEDIIGDLPCRFKYVETVPNDFGLTIEEILLAKNKELNQWASLKKTLQIRPDHVEKKDQRLYKLKSKNEMLKRKIFKSIYGESSDEEEDPQDEEKKPFTEQKPAESTEASILTQTTASKQKKKKKRKSIAAKNILNDANEVKKMKLECCDDEKIFENNTASPASIEGLSPVKETLKSIKKAKKMKQNQLHAQLQQPSQVSQSSSAISDFHTTKTKDINVHVNPFAGVKNNNLQTETNETSSRTANRRNPFAFTRNNNTHSETIATLSDGGNPFANVKSKKAESKPHITGSKNKVQRNSSFTGAKIFKSQKFNKQRTHSKIPFNAKTNKKRPAFNKKQSKSGDSTSDRVQINDDRLKAYNINPRKFHKKQNYAKKAQK